MNLQIGRAESRDDHVAWSTNEMRKHVCSIAFSGLLLVACTRGQPANDEATAVQDDSASKPISVIEPAETESSSPRVPPAKDLTTIPKTRPWQPGDPEDERPRQAGEEPE